MYRCLNTSPRFALLFFTFLLESHVKVYTVVCCAVYQLDRFDMCTNCVMFVLSSFRQQVVTVIAIAAAIVVDVAAFNRIALILPLITNIFESNLFHHYYYMSCHAVCFVNALRACDNLHNLAANHLIGFNRMTI